MDISLLQPQDHEQYENYLSMHSSALLYYSLAYRDFIKELIEAHDEYWIAKDANKNIIGILPMMSNRDLDHKIYNSLPYFGSHGGILANDANSAEKLVSKYNAIVSQDSISASTLINNPINNFDQSEIKYNYSDFRIGMFTDISHCNVPETEILSRIDPSARRNINRAKKENIQIEINNTELDILKQLHQENIGSIGGICKSEKFFNLIPKYFIPEKDYNLYIAKKDNQIISALLIFYYGKTVEYFVPGIDKNFRETQALSLIIFSSMLDASKKGYLWWNWGGTWKTQEGVYRFKKKWATMEQPYFYFTQLNNNVLLTMTKSQLQKKFENFFVVPYDALIMEQK